ncbi:S8 family peptidase [Thermobispora bispora]|uniref:S8 family peptidase n=1 Tax=Thermobispora bispora TaxID=2006 RepID=UPI00198020FE|nr:S8 family serine peptidase [Thermobispora bispora]MBO2475528.1 serine protease [Actinomycetales bacterium]QSI49288.1 serine protease [Thermobispora bispora]
MLKRLACAVAAALCTVPLVPGTAAADQVRATQERVLRMLGVPQAWTITRGRGVIVAVLDSGVDPNHRDLAGSVITGKDFTAGANPRGVAPPRLHGTYMASLIAGHGHGPGNADGVIGVAPEAKVLSVRVLLEDQEPGFREFNRDPRFEGVVAKGIRYAVDHGADVINLSLSKDRPTKEERDAIRYAISKGVVLVAAAGNAGEGRRTAPYSYPAAIPGVISVAAVTPEMQRAPFSTRNSSVMVAAPGVDVLGAGPGDEYWVGRGTSQAAALVSGVAALIKSRYPKLPPALVAQALCSSPVRSSGYNTGTGFGVVHAYRALTAAAALAGHRFTASGRGVRDPRLPIRATAPAAGPITLVRRDRRAVAVRFGVAAVAFTGTAGGVAVVAVLRRRRTAGRDAPVPLSPRPTGLPT